MSNFTCRALWWVFVASLVVWVLAAHVAPPPVNPPASLSPLTMALAGVSLVIAIGTIVYRRRALAGPIQAGHLDPTTPVGLQRAFPVFILNVVLSESVGIFGLVLSLLSGRPTYVMAFAAGAFALLYLHRPTAPDLVPPLGPGQGGSRPPPLT